jgi:hypothetical protein
MSDIPHILRIHGRKITLGIDDTDPTPDGLLEKAADRIEALEQALRVIAEMPVPEQDNMIAANMRRIAIGAIK